ncbi:MAG: hypothetical protein K2N16_06825 [Muribaculaceae bacterium]|nr:hypothetical protein [Muribaculaceae bacterium]
MDKNHALEVLLNLTNNTLGFVPSTPTEFNELSLAIEQKTGRSLSLSSIKRLWGYIKYDGYPSSTTLNTLAKFNGYKNWDTFLMVNIEGTDYSGFIEESIVNTEELNVGDKIVLRWGGEKSCEIECIAPARFRVNQSHNIKLLAGDTFTLHTIFRGHPLYVSDIQRGEQLIPAYIGAKKGGIASIFLITR